MTVDGVGELQQQLRGLADREVRRPLRSGVGKGLTVVAKAIRQAAPVGKTRSIRKAIGKRFARNRRSGEMEAKAGIDVGKKRSRDGSKGIQARHGHLVALGTAERFTKTGAKRGSVRANDFVGRGFAASASQAAAVIVNTVADGIAAAAGGGS